MHHAPSALQVLRAMGATQPSPEGFVRLGDALRAIFNQAVPLPAIARALREGSVWESGFRSQHLRTLGGDQTFKSLVEMHRGAFVDVNRIDEVARGLAAGEHSSEVLERHVAEAMRQLYGVPLDSPLGRLCVNAERLVVRVTELEQLMSGQPSAESVLPGWK